MIGRILCSIATVAMVLLAAAGVWPWYLRQRARDLCADVWYTEGSAGRRVIGFPPEVHCWQNDVHEIVYDGAQFMPGVIAASACLVVLAVAFGTRSQWVSSLGSRRAART
ncbi:hypothetical protein [Occultella gossypii]|uniref:Integral membrane protein n=1 Tax=Occultella gossypii TaxID=2800820 RepID=A0ABS7S4Y1_9MICO|nr:hypothetical protein [Occultella gossypii]MBZ2195389.1 hypothetical protein [Occultella gossypii]